MPSITVNTEGGSYVIENDSVANVADLFREVADTLNIAPGANIAVNGAPATPETPLAEGDEVSTTKPGGRKGV